MGYGEGADLAWKTMKGFSLILSSFLTTLLIGSNQTVDTSTPHFPDGLLGTKQREEKAIAPAWLVILPFQNAPGPAPHDADLQNLNPFGKPDRPDQEESHQSGIRFDRCIDTDTCLFIRPGENNTTERRVAVELFGIDVPHLRESCGQETLLAKDAMAFLHQLLSEASQIDIYDHYKVGRKHMARVVVDGQDLSQLLLSQGFAAPRGLERKNWCTD